LLCVRTGNHGSQRNRVDAVAHAWANGLSAIANIKEIFMTSLKQIAIDLSQLSGVDLSQIPNRRFSNGLLGRVRLSGSGEDKVKAAISAASLVSTIGEWAEIPQAYEKNLITASIKLPVKARPSPGPIVTSSSVTAPPPPSVPAVKPSTIGVTIGGTISAIVGPNVAVGIYVQLNPAEFGLLGSAAISVSTSAGVTGAIQLLLVDGPITALDGTGFTVVVDIGTPGVRVFAGLGVILDSSFSVIGCIIEFGGGLDIAPPVSVTATVGSSGHVKLL
jgi:hypothetical protein